MGSFILDTSDDVMLEQADVYISWQDQYDPAAIERKDPYIISQYHREWLIRKVVLMIEQEIVRHSIWEKMDYCHWVFKSLEEQRAYIEKFQKEYPKHRLEVERIIGKNFLKIYHEEKNENNERVLKRLKESKWTDSYGLDFYLPFFYKDGRFRELKKEQYYYNKTNL
jgi:Mg2+ and Co2+ transporter CorA